MTKKLNLNAAILCGLLAPAAQAAAFSVTPYDCPGGVYTAPISINASGQVTGECDDNTGWHAFVKNGAATTTFDGGAPNYVTGGTSINAGGTVTGSYNDGLNPTKGFVYINGVTSLFTILDSTNAPAFLVNPRSINAGGKVVGEFLDANGIYRGFIYDSANTANLPTIIDAMGVAPGNWTIPVSINDSNQVTGTAANTHGFLYSAGVVTLFDAPNAAQTVPRSINNSGQVVGMYYDINYIAHGFLYSGGALTTIDIPGAAVTATDIWSINDSGQMAGYYTDASGSHAFAQTGTAGTPTTFDVPAAIGSPIGTVPRSINTSGQVTGWYTDSLGSTHGFVTSAIGSAVTLSSCAKPKGAKSAAGHGVVTEAGADYVKVFNLRIDYANCTHMNYGGNAKVPAVNDLIEWEGYHEPNGNVMGKTLGFN